MLNIIIYSLSVLKVRFQNIFLRTKETCNLVTGPEIDGTVQHSERDRNLSRMKAKTILCWITGKKRRLTIIECNNDINSMIDLAKVADLVSHQQQSMDIKTLFATNSSHDDDDKFILPSPPFLSICHYVCHVPDRRSVGISLCLPFYPSTSFFRHVPCSPETSIFNSSARMLLYSRPRQWPIHFTRC